jgi:hypothetical protein
MCTRFYRRCCDFFFVFCVTQFSCDCFCVTPCPGCSLMCTRAICYAFFRAIISQSCTSHVTFTFIFICSNTDGAVARLSAVLRPLAALGAAVDSVARGGGYVTPGRFNFFLFLSYFFLVLLIPSSLCLPCLHCHATLPTSHQVGSITLARFCQSLFIPYFIPSFFCFLSHEVGSITLACFCQA